MDKDYKNLLNKYSNKYHQQKIFNNLKGGAVKSTSALIQ